MLFGGCEPGTETGSKLGLLVGTGTAGLSLASVSAVLATDTATSALWELL